MYQRLRHTGFSLIELMTAVGIIAILAMIAVLYHGKYVLRARAAEIPINIDAIFRGAQVYWRTEHPTPTGVYSYVFPAKSWAWAPSPMGFNCVYPNGKYPAWPWLWASIPEFDAVGFILDAPSVMSYSFYPNRFVANVGTQPGDDLIVSAIGDLACDGPPWTNIGRTMTVDSKMNLTSSALWINYSEAN